MQTDFFKKDCIVDIDIKTNSIKEGKTFFYEYSNYIIY